MMVQVQSSNIAAIGYESSSHKLAVRFNSGECYLYHDVPAEVHVQFTNASSLGSFLNANIKQKYLTTKVSDDEIQTLFQPKVSTRKVSGLTGAKRQKLMFTPRTFMYF